MNGPVAQLIRHLTTVERITGSIPIAGLINFLFTNSFKIYWIRPRPFKKLCDILLVWFQWPRGPMDKASDYESGDSRFESWRGRSFLCLFIV